MLTRQVDKKENGNALLIRRAVEDAIEIIERKHIELAAWDPTKPARPRIKEDKK